MMFRACTEKESDTNETSSGESERMLFTATTTSRGPFETNREAETIPDTARESRLKTLIENLHSEDLY